MIVLRKAVLEDIPNIYEQLHLNYVKKYCKGEEEAQWEIHKKWYTFLINSSSYILYTIEDIGGKFLGSIKFEIENETSIICIFIAKELRGKGYSKIIIESSIDEMKFEKPEVSVVLAYILEENEISILSFEKSGFIYEGMEEYEGVDNLLYVKWIDRN